jgi:hypothetical protein
MVINCEGYGFMGVLMVFCFLVLCMVSAICYRSEKFGTLRNFVLFGVADVFLALSLILLSIVLLVSFYHESN